MEEYDLFETTEKDCTFCKIITGEKESPVVYDDELFLAFLDFRPLLRGHCLLVPKAHYETIHDLPEGLTGLFFSRVKRLARAVETALKADGSFIAINTRISQSVPHLHIHIVPRWKKDGLFSKAYIWKRQPYANEEDMTAVQDAIRSALKC
jgi:histidine triad (HIT) family protein